MSFSNSTATGYDLTSSSSSYALTLTNIGAGTTSDALNGTDTSGTNTIDAALVLGASSGTQTFTQAAGGTMKLNGTVTGSSALTLSLVGSGSSSTFGTYDFAANNSGTLASAITLGTGTTLLIGSDQALGTGLLTVSGSNVVIQNDSGTSRTLANALNLSAITTFGTISNPGGNLTFGGVTLAGSQTVVVNNAITTVASIAPDATASRALTKQGTGALVVTGAKTNTGAVDIQGGVLAVGGAYTTAGNLQLDGGVLALNGTFSENLGTSSAQTQFVAAKNGGFAAYGTNATFGNTANNLSVNIGGNATPSTLTWGTTTNFLASGQTLILGSTVSNGTVTLANPLNLGGATQTIEVDRGATATAGSADAILSATSGVIAGTGSVIKTGAGTLSLNAAYTTYSGSLTINGGIVATTGASFFGSSGSAININSGTLRYDATYTGGSNAIVVGTSTSTIDVSGSNSFTPGAISGTGSLTKAGTGTLSIDPSGTSYSGSLTINSGVVDATTASYFGTSGSAININAGTLKYDATYTGAQNTITLGSSTSTIDVSPTYSYTPGVVSGTGSLTKTDTGTLTLSSANTYSGGTTVSNGTLTVNTGGTLGASTGSLAVNAATGITTALNLNVSQTVNGLSGTIAGTGTATITIASGFTLSSTQSGNTEYDGIITGAGSLIKDGTGTLSLTNTNSYTGGTTINGGTLAINGPNRLGGTLMVNNGTFQFTTINGVGSSITSSRNIVLGSANSTIQIDSGLSYTATTGVLSGMGALNKTGLGTLILQAANTYSGATSISGGVLNPANTSGIALVNTTQINVNNGGTLLLGANNQLNTTAPISIGSTSGSGTAKLDGGGFVQGTSATVGLGALTLTASSTIDLTGTSLLHFAASSTATTGAVLSILDWNGTLMTGGGSEELKFGAANTDLGYLSQIQFVNPTGLSAGIYAASFASGDPGEVVPNALVMVPEPATLLGGVLMVGAAGWSQRRRVSALLSRASRGLQAKLAA